MDRRSFLKTTMAAGAAVAAGGLVTACSTSAEDTATAGGTGGGGGARAVKLGFIALTDCAPLVIAKENGYFAERNLDVSIEKQASWPALRDALLNGTLDGAHCLFSMPLSVATSLGGQGSRALKIAMVLNQNGQAITLANDLADAGYGDLGRARAALDKKGSSVLAMTFPGGTHDTWLRYWLKATGVDMGKIKIDPVPPPQMVQNMTVGNVQGYCVGEPWNAVAVKQNIGFTALASQDLWEFHPEKALVVNERFAGDRTDVLRDLMAAVLQACKWLDLPENRAKAAEIIGVPAYVNALPDDIRPRLTGEYDLGAGLGTRNFEGRQMQFFRDGQVNAPRRAHAIWFLTQYQRFGLLKQAPDHRGLADSLILSDLYREVATAQGITVPDDDMAPFDVKLDNIRFDPSTPDVEAARS